MKKILIVDDDHDICMLLSRFLSKNDFKTREAYKGSEALSILKEDKYDLVLCDFRLPDIDGVELLTQIKEINPATAIIIITGYSDVKIAVKAIKLGAFDYVTKPIHPEEILSTINKALVAKPVQNVTSTEIKDKRYIKGNSKKDKIVQKHIDLVAPTDMSVIINGETGTGKEMVAGTIHQKSKRADKPFIAIDCGALPKDLAGSEFFGHEKGAFTGAVGTKIGNFELANGGTLFLDEIGNLSYDIQVKLLRVLQEKKFRRVGGIKDISTDVRIIAASNEDLKKAYEDGKFREDLYHRLNEFAIEVAPIRKRKEDIMKFAEHFLSMANGELGKNVTGFTEETEQVILNYPWYGNLRELKNVIKRAVLLCTEDAIDLECLPQEIVDYSDQVTYDFSETEGNADLKSAAKVAERDAIVNALDQTNYNKTKAARMLNIDRKTLYNKLKSYNISID
jgi:two-component system response regulator HydG